jgi:hypothetical protein
LHDADLVRNDASVYFCCSGAYISLSFTVRVTSSTRKIVPVVIVRDEPNRHEMGLVRTEKENDNLELSSIHVIP